MADTKLTFDPEKLHWYTQNDKFTAQNILWIKVSLFHLHTTQERPMNTKVFKKRVQNFKYQHLHVCIC